MRGAAALLAVLSLTGAAPAAASTVAVRGDRLVYSASPGEFDGVDPRVEAPGDGAEQSYVFSDSPVPGAGCRRPEGRQDTWCRKTGVSDMLFDLGDLGDYARIDVPVPAFVLGGTGDDFLFLAREGFVNGGDGDDRLLVDVGSDAGVRAGAGRDAVYLSFDFVGEPRPMGRPRRPGWTVSLQTGRIESFGGRPRSREISGVEKLTGSSLADRITGDAGGNSIVGFLGTDRISGRGGDDRLDALDHYRDPDAHHATNDHYRLARDTIACGGGRDRVRADVRDRWSGDCERVRVYGLYKRTGLNYDLEPVPVDAARLVRFVLNGDGAGERLSGSRAAANSIAGRGGDDVISGGRRRDSIGAGAGADSIDARHGRDRIRAGTGDDTVVALDRQRDTISCGGGTDTVAADRRDRVARDCEVVRRPQRQ